MSDKLDEKALEAAALAAPGETREECRAVAEPIVLAYLAACPGSTGAAEGWVLVPLDLIERAQHQLSASPFPFDRCVGAEISAMLSAAGEREE